jgi:GntR family transcriptional repressor for pyruvate dehydrogenase complex
VEHFVQARTAVETYGVRLAVKNLTEGDLRNLERINEELAGTIADTKRLGEKNMAFHLSIAEISGNSLMTMMVQSLIETLDKILETRTPRRFQDPNFAEATYKRHQKIIDAMREKNFALCEELIAKDAEFTKKINY